MMVRFKFGKPKEWLPKVLAIFARKQAGEKIGADLIGLVKSIDGKDPKQAVLELIDDLVYRCGLGTESLTVIEGKLQELIVAVEKLSFPTDGHKVVLLAKLNRLKKYVEPTGLGVVIDILELIKTDIERGVK